MNDWRWLHFAILSAVCAAFVGIFAKLGMKDVDATLATVVRSIIMTVVLCLIGIRLHLWSKIETIRISALTAIGLSGIAGALSWLFYFKAIQLSEVSRVAPIDKLSMPLAIVLAVLLLGERPSIINWLGIVLIVGGAYLAVVQRSN